MGSVAERFLPRRCSRADQAVCPVDFGPAEARATIGRIALPVHPLLRAIERKAPPGRHRPSARLLRARGLSWWRYVFERHHPRLLQFAGEACNRAREARLLGRAPSQAPDRARSRSTASAAFERWRNLSSPICHLAVGRGVSDLVGQRIDPLNVSVAIYGVTPTTFPFQSSSQYWTPSWATIARGVSNHPTPPSGPPPADGHSSLPVSAPVAVSSSRT